MKDINKIKEREEKKKEEIKGEREKHRERRRRKGGKEEGSCLGKEKPLPRDDKGRLLFVELTQGQKSCTKVP